jgi:hypothetical protein
MNLKTLSSTSWFNKENGLAHIITTQIRECKEQKNDPSGDELQERVVIYNSYSNSWLDAFFDSISHEYKRQSLIEYI